MSRLARWLGRTTASGEFIPEADGLRALAIGAVVLHHITASYLRSTARFGSVDLPAQWWDVFPRSLAIAVGYAGQFGVPLFFVISGFVLALPFVRSYRGGVARPHLGSYYLRRVTRLHGPYAVNVAAAFLLIVLTNVGWRTFVPHILPTLLYVHGPIFGQASWVNGVAWSLEVEVQFSLVLPALATVFAIRPAMCRRVVLVASTLGLAYAASHLRLVAESPRLQTTVLNYLQFFVAGLLLADLYHGRAGRGLPRSLAGDAAALAAAAGIWVVLTRRYDYYYLTPLLVAVLYMGVCCGRIGHACITRRPIVVLGGMCYTIYLYHFLVIDLTAPWAAPFTSLGRRTSLDLLLYGALLTGPVLLVSIVMFAAVEKPFMRLSGRLGRRFRRASGPHLAAILTTDPVPTEPVQADDVPASVIGVHVLAHEAQWLQTIWSLKSFYRASGTRFPLTVHIQGSSRQLESGIRQHFPDARIVSQAEADAVVEPWLTSRGFPRLLAARRELFLLMKLVDVRLFARTPFVIYFDSDVLFFRRPEELIAVPPDERTAAHLFMRDDYYSYCLTIEQARSAFGVQLVPFVNGGIMRLVTGAIDLAACELFLQHPDLSGGHWHVEQTLHALNASAQGRVTLLPSSYAMARGFDEIPGMVARHYITPIRPLLVQEGLTRLVAGWPAAGRGPVMAAQ